MSQNQVDLTLENFRDVMLETSAQKLVVVYFYSSQVPESMQQLTVTEQFLAAYPEAVLLATVNCDAQPQIVQQFGVQGLPTTILVKDGQPVDGFAGEQTPEELQKTFADHLPKPEDELFAKGNELVAQEDYQQAFALFKQAYDINSERADIKIALADAAVETGNLDLSKSLINDIGLVDQQSEYQVVVGKIELAEKASESPELLELQEKHRQDPSNLQIKVDLAIQLQQAHKAEEALALIYEVVAKDLAFGDAKKMMLDMLNALADGDPLKSSYRRKLYSLLY